MLHKNSDRRVVLKPWQESLNEAWKNGATVAAAAPPPHSPGAPGLPHCTLLDLPRKGLIKTGEI